MSREQESARTDRRPRIADLIPRLQLRGAEVFAQHLETALADRYASRLFPIFADGEPAGVPGSPDISRATKGGGFRAILDVRRRVRAFRPDLVVAHGGTPLRTAALARLDRLAPIVYVRVAPIPSRLRTAARMALLRATYRRAAAVVAVSESLRKELSGDFGVPDERITVIRNGRPKLPPLGEGERGRIREELGARPADTLIVWVGRMVPEKDPLAAVEVARRLSDSGSAARLAIIGDGPLLRETRDRAGGLDGIDWEEPRADVPRVIAAADFLLSTSSDEGGPGVVIEALLAGVPVVAFDTGGIRELVEPGTSGLLAPTGSVAGLADLAVRLVNDPEASAALGEGASRSGERFEIGRVAAEYDRLYRSLR